MSAWEIDGGPENQSIGVRSLIPNGGMMARPKRFELLTPRFVVWCSIQLSYGRVFCEAANLCIEAA